MSLCDLPDALHLRIIDFIICIRWGNPAYVRLSVGRLRAVATTFWNSAELGDLVVGSFSESYRNLPPERLYPHELKEKLLYTISFLLGACHNEYRQHGSQLYHEGISAACLLNDPCYDSENKAATLHDMQVLRGVGTSWIAGMPSLALELRSVEVFLTPQPDGILRLLRARPEV